MRSPLILFPQKIPKGFRHSIYIASSVPSRGKKAGLGEIFFEIFRKVLVFQQKRILSNFIGLQVALVIT
jgi:hypothetical protein